MLENSRLSEDVRNFYRLLRGEVKYYQVAVKEKKEETHRSGVFSKSAKEAKLLYSEKTGFISLKKIKTKRDDTEGLIFLLKKFACLKSEGENNVVQQ